MKFVEINYQPPTACLLWYTISNAQIQRFNQFEVHETVSSSPSKPAHRSHRLQIPQSLGNIEKWSSHWQTAGRLLNCVILQHERFRPFENHSIKNLFFESLQLYDSRLKPDSKPPEFGDQPIHPPCYSQVCAVVESHPLPMATMCAGRSLTIETTLTKGDSIDDPIPRRMEPSAPEFTN